MERECLPGVRAKCPDCDGPQCTYSPGSQCEEENLNYIAPDVRAEPEAYRATGLTPETVVQLKGIAEIFNCDPADPAQLKSLCVKLRELAQTERDGRLVVLPCKVGDTVYRVFHPKGCKPAMGEHKVRTIGDAALLAGHMGEGFLVDNYLTRQEAVAAVERLKGEGEHG